MIKTSFHNVSPIPRVGWLLILLMLCGGVASFVVCVTFDFAPGLKYIALLPLMYCLVFSLILVPLTIETRSWTIIIFSICSYLRYCALPVALAIDPVYIVSHYTPSSSSVEDAIGYMSYELLVLCIFLLLSLGKIKRLLCPANKRDLLIEQKGGFVCKIFVIAAVIIFVLVPGSRDGLDFFSIDIGTGVRKESASTTLSNVLRQIIVVGQLVAFVLISVWAKRKQEETQCMTKYFMVALLFALFCVSIIVDERRSVQIYSAFACIVFLMVLFPEKKKIIFFSIAGLAAIALVLLTIYKNFYAFNYSSYAEALLNDNAFAGIGKTAELYLLGPISTAAGLDSGSMAGMNLSSMLYGICRHTIGISFLVKDLGLSTPVELYNQFISGGVSASGFLLPVGVELAACTNVAFGPLYPACFLAVAFLIESIIRTTKSPMILFFAAYVYIRFATCTVSSASSSILVSSSSVIAIVAFILLLEKIMTRGSNENRCTKVRNGDI